jgi:hypothetical protein
MQRVAVVVWSERWAVPPVAAARQNHDGADGSH